jgi:hypothetical protein
MLAAIGPAAFAQTIPITLNVAPTRAPREVAVEVPPPAIARPSHPPTGWGTYATFKGRTLDLRAAGLSLDGAGWANDARVLQNDVEAGYGWRGQGVSATVGYAEHALTPSPSAMDRIDPEANRGKPRGDPGVFGLSLTLRR